MAETDILNPVQGWSNELGLNPNWSYGWVRKTASNKKLAQPRLGRRYSREVMNAGYSASLNWLDQPYAQVLRLKQFFEQYQGGYFTLINWDGDGRHHVGNFINEPNEVQTANGKWTIQGLEFQEAAQARMLQYPSDFGSSAHAIYAVDDYLTPRVVTYSGLPHSVAHPGWFSQPTPTASSIYTTRPEEFETFISSPSAGDFAQIEYVGWGFKMVFRGASNLGQCDIYLDGQYLLTLDQSTGATVPAQAALPPGVSSMNGIVTALQVPLDKHRLKVVANGNPGMSGANGQGIVFPAVRVIH